jgi:hypothetical protein
MIDSSADPSPSFFSQRRRRGLLWLVVFLCVASWYGVSDSRYFKSDPAKWRIRGDFTNFSLAASRVMAKGGDPYDSAQVGRNYKYFPLNALLLTPLAFMPIPMAQGVFLGINSVLLIWALMAHYDLMGRNRAAWAAWIVALLLGGRYILISVQLGQWNLPVYTLTILGLWLILCKRRRITGGALIGLAAGIKFMPAFFIFYFLAKRQWKTAACVLLAILFWVLIFPTLFLGVERHKTLLKTYVEKSKGRVADMVGEKPVVGHSLSTTIIAYLSDIEKQSVHRSSASINVLDLPLGTAQIIAKSVSVLLVIFVLGLMAWRGPGLKPDAGLLMELGLVFILLLLISPEARKAQFLGLLTAGLGLGMVMVDRSNALWERRAAFVSFLVAGLVTLVSSAILPEAARNWLHTHGSLTLVMLILFANLSLFLIRDRRKTRALEPSLGRASLDRGGLQSL